MPTTITGTDGVSQVQTGAVESGDLPAGSVIQRVINQDIDAGDIGTTSTSLVASGIQASITPTSSSNYIDVYFSVAMTFDAPGELESKMYVNGSEWPNTGDYNVSFRAAGIYAPSVFFLRYYPANTSTLTFEPFFKSRNGGLTRLVHVNTTYALVLTEIAG